MVTITRTPDRQQWNHYVTGHGKSLFTHLWGWGSSLARVYAQQIFHLAACSDGPGGGITGVLPLIMFTQKNGGSRLISLPYSDSAGILADDRQSAAALLDEALRLAAGYRAKHLELRHAAPGSAGVDDCLRDDRGWRNHSFKVGVSRSLPGSARTLWRDLSAKVRNQVRKARKNGCDAAVGGRELLDSFYLVFAQNMRDLGSPVHHRALFDEVAAELDGFCRVVVVRYDATPVAAAMVFRCRDTLYNPWASSLRHYRPLCPNMLLYWTMLEYGCNSGCTVFDFGRSSPEASTCRFKLQWGARMTPLAWQVISLADPPWDPRSERLEYNWIKNLSLEQSLRAGPPLRRLISL
ncbi:GNAT family N-acetyltransferase [Desulforhopalus singaporensis]|uniref:FemAB-related protein, PEP-CTERM system-associated n=1 Tax=Desulforhopalus singaporensis TaxID=91360 RepID=A0A1H0KRX4_9BACT|nr:GNAT family N-acetyltransferase [Desulforhopalus singaporensis]SDO58500.1 FemAB-related protein, PEP-CTERM system-associated [Desulforhopalus singaporensis]